MSLLHGLAEIELFHGWTVCLPLSVEEGVCLIDEGPCCTDYREGKATDPSPHPPDLQGHCTKLCSLFLLKGTWTGGQMETEMQTCFCLSSHMPWPGMNLPRGTLPFLNFTRHYLHQALAQWGWVPPTLGYIFLISTRATCSMHSSPRASGVTRAGGLPVYTVAAGVGGFFFRNLTPLTSLW